jgi:hypothetical protein
MWSDLAIEILLDPFQFYPIPNAKEQSDCDEGASKPNIQVHITRLKMLKSPSVQIDSAMGSLGFLAQNRSYLRFRDL